MSDVSTLSFNSSRLLRSGVNFHLRFGRSIGDNHLLRHGGWSPQASDSLYGPFNDDAHAITQHSIGTLHLQVLKPDTSNMLIHLDFKTRHRNSKCVKAIQLCGFNVRNAFFLDILAGPISSVDKIRWDARALDGANVGAELGFQHHQKASQSIFGANVGMGILERGDFLVIVMVVVVMMVLVFGGFYYC
jgi:hypothetical protein